MSRNAKARFQRCIGYLSFIKDRIKLSSLQTLALAQLQPSKSSEVKSYKVLWGRVWKVSEDMFWSIRRSGEVLSKLKEKGFWATSLSTYDF